MLLKDSLLDPNRLKYIQNKLIEILSSYYNCISEEDIKIQIVNRILIEVLKIKLDDLKFERTDVSGRTDIKVCIGETDRTNLIVECKGPKIELDKKNSSKYLNALSQSSKYSIFCKTSKVIITNGKTFLGFENNYLIFESHSITEFIDFNNLKIFLIKYNASTLYSDSSFLISPPYDTFPFIGKYFSFISKKEIDSIDFSNSRYLEELSLLNEVEANRIDEEIRKKIALFKNNLNLKKTSIIEKSTVLHIDNSFSNYYKSAWIYDPIYLRTKEIEGTLFGGVEVKIEFQFLRIFLFNDLDNLKINIKDFENVADYFCNNKFHVSLALISEFLELGIRPGDYLGSGYSLLYEDSRKFLFETKISNKEISTIRNITIDFIKKRKGLIFDKSKLYELKNFVSDILIDKKNYYNWL